MFKEKQVTQVTAAIFQGKTEEVPYICEVFCFVFTCLARLVSWWECGTLLLLPVSVSFCYLKGLPSHKAFCKRQFVIN